MSRRFLTSLTLAATVGAMAVVVPSTGAVTDEQLQGAIHGIEPNVDDIDLDASITELEQEARAGDTITVTLDANVLFDFGSAAIPPFVRERLRGIGEGIPLGARVMVTGHTDSIGSTADNQRLSEQRARAVADALRVGNGSLRLVPSGRGELEPVAPNGTPAKDDPDGRARNRRVVVEWQA